MRDRDLDMTFGFHGVQVYGNLHFMLIGGESIAWHRWTGSPHVERCYRWQCFKLSAPRTPQEVDKIDTGWTIADPMELAGALHQFVLETLAR